MSKIVKFTHERMRAEITPFDGFAELSAYRRKLRELRLIGIDSNGVSFGNVSVRDGTSRNFFITGSATGGTADLGLADCAKIVAYDFKTNWVKYEGAAIPSSESLTHAAIYESDAMAAAVIHCHDLYLWATIQNRAPTSSKKAGYGTPEIACEIIRLFKATDLHSRKILAMAGHEGGIVTFGRDLEEAFAVLMRERTEAAPCI